MTANVLILEALEHFEKFEDKESVASGLCNVIDEYCPNAYCEMNDHFESWEHFSGDIIYPVPSPIEILGPGEFYRSRDGRFYSGTYGHLRLDLMRHIIARTKKQLEIYNNLDSGVIEDIIEFLKKEWTNADM